jgi:hypothetical protein
MSQKKIDSWEATNIAKAIAEKAFEHITPPLKQKLSDALEGAYAKTVRDLKLDKQETALVEAGVLVKTSRVNLLFGPGKKEDPDVYESATASFAEPLGEDSHTRKSDGSVVANPKPYLCSTLRVTDKALIDKVRAIRDELNPWYSKCNQMQLDIRNQITGKSATHVCKTWPEVAGFVRDYFEMTESQGLTVPFESLVRKYLLALPAPEMAEA